MVTLKPITAENWRECVKLKVADEQKDYVAPNWASLLQIVYEFQDAQPAPTGIYNGETMVGFVLHTRPLRKEKRIYYIMRLMIGKEFQRRGFGRAAMKRLIDEFTADAQHDSIYISYVPENEAAAKLYADLGFIDEGEREHGEIVVRRPIK